MRIVHRLDATTIPARAAQTTGRPAVVLPTRMLLPARLAFTLFALLAVSLPAIPVYVTVRDTGGWLAVVGGSTDGQKALSDGGSALFAYVALGSIGALRIVILFCVGMLLVWRSREVIAFLVALLVVAIVGADFPPNLFQLLSTEPLRAILGLFVTYWFPLMLVVIFYVFPDGRFTPRWTIAPAILWAGSLAWTFIVTRTFDGPGGWPRLIVPLVLLGSIIVAQTYRYFRVSGPVERQQTKWLLGGLGTLLTTFAAGNAVLAVTGGFNDVPPPSADVIWPIFEAVSGLATIGLPIALAIAVLKYRLFDLDLVVNRALVYGGLTVSVVGIYVLVVGYLGALFRTGGNLFISLFATALVAIVFQPLRERLQRGANRLLWGQRDEPYAVLTGLGRQLEATLAPNSILPTIVETVAAALKLPYVAVTLQMDDGTQVVAEYGDEESSSAEIVPLVHRGERVGELRLSPRPGEHVLSTADRRLIDDLARQAGMAVHSLQLTQDLQRARERLVSGREEERRRLRRDLHDGLGPSLASQALTIDAASLLIERDPRAAFELLREAKAQSRAAVSEIRRVVYDLRPPALDDLGLQGALRDLAGHFSGANLTIDIQLPDALPVLPAAVEVAVFRIVQESLTNVARHAGATHCSITLKLTTALELTISDDGIGISDARRAGVGLASMKERAEELGGTCSVNGRSERGTVVAVRLPLEV